MIRKLSHIVLRSACLIILLASCDRKIDSGDQNTLDRPIGALFSLMHPDSTGINFINKIENREDFNIFSYRNFYNGGGVSIGDINNDGLVDIYLTSNFGKNKLYLNKGNFRFEDISDTAMVEGSKAWSTGVVMVDINSDGLLDIYVCNAGNIKGDSQKNELFINKGNLTFEEKAKEYRLDEGGTTTHAAFFDFDKDGDLDVYILNNSFVPVNSLNYSNKRELRAEQWQVPEILKGGGDKLLRNDDGKFTDISGPAGIYGSLIGFGLGVTISDINDDLYPDIYVSNDFYERDYLYINQGDGTFKEEIEKYTEHTSLASMGADIQDINNDGLPDIFVTDMLPEGDERLKNTTNFESYNTFQRKLSLDFHHQYMQNVLQLNLGNNVFSDIGFHANVAKTDWSWGALLFDMDNDGFKDIYVCNGIYHDLTNQDFIDFFANDIVRKMMLKGEKEEKAEIIDRMPSKAIPNYAFKNLGDLSFSNVTESWGFDTPSFSNGAAYADLDNDGDLDLVMNNVNQHAFVYRNRLQETDPKNYIKIACEGEGNNTFAVGAIVKLFYKDKVFRQEIIPTRGFQSSTEYNMTFGLGSIEMVDSLQVFWPDQTTTILKNVAVNQELTLSQNTAEKNWKKRQHPIKPLLRNVDNGFVEHKEDPYNDFDHEGLIAQKLSQEGPALALGDINGDGLEDFFVGGAKGQKATIYLQNDQNGFRALENKLISEDRFLEDTAASFLDADGDGDLDLVVGAGGNIAQDKKSYRNRLYINDGRGKYISKKYLKSTGDNVSTINPYDFDADGDEDLFIGCRSVPGIYGISPKHLLLENDGNGNFKDVTQSKAYALKGIGMLTDAEWADIDGDQNKDLVIVGDWMSPKILKNSGKRLSLLNTSLDSISGWWNAVEVEDLDNDGRLDLLLGNRGTNIPYKPTAEEPIKLFVNDFDDNGTIEQISTRTIQGKDTPIILKKELTEQITSLKRNSLAYAEYAKKTMADLFDKEVLNSTIVRKVVESRSLIALNKGEKRFDISAMPKEVQFSSANAFMCTDLDKDGFLDVLVGGNNFDLKPQYSRLDGNFGSLLSGNKNAVLQWVPYSKSGFFVRGEIKAIEAVKSKNGQTKVLVARNNLAPLLFTVNE